MQGNKKRRRSKVSYYVNILLVSAVTFIVYGLILNFTSDNSLFGNPLDKIKNEESTVNITTEDGSEVIPGNTTTGNGGSLGGNSSNVIGNGGSLGGQVTEGINTNPTPSSGNSGGSTYTPPAQTQQPQQQVQPTYPTLEETNNTFRQTIQNTYSVTVKYGAETEGYTVGGITTTPIYDANTINSALNSLNNALAKYPQGFFAEIKKGGIPLTVILIHSYANNSITGVTDSNYSFAHISIAISHPFEESFFHESYHYIERYIFKKGGNFSAWDSLNPTGFVYNQNISNANSYANTFSNSAPFVNTYAQTAATEDRASTFEYMMASSKAGCLNTNMPVWKKASMISGMIDAVFTTVTPSTVEYWERHL